ncbi:MAG TPA: plastocyanin/azurin family copper-binding protein [Chloroflexota bacterium]|nr:plastocyanin/azurin family copper-binding protein [Chloroflexota bacterium]
MNGRGFLGTNASLVSDLSLVLGILVAVFLTIGVAMAVRKKFHAHRWIQSAAVTLNVLQVAIVMLGSFARSAAPGIPSRLNDSYYAVALGHGLLGLTTLLLGVFIAIRANELLPPFLRKLRFHNFKLFMRTAYGLYLLSTALGVSAYVTWYVVKPEEPATAVQTAVQAEAQGQTQDVVVPMKDFAFAPKEIIVPVGSTLVWVNQDRTPHTATADDGHSFQSDLLASGQSFRLTLDEVGELRYYCELHGSSGGVGMSGIIRVVAQGDPPQPIAVAALPPPAPQPTQVADESRLPNEALPGIQQLLVDGPGLPVRQGYAVGLASETREMERHARLLVQAQAAGDVPGIRRHAEHIFNLIVGAADAEFGDLDGDGRAQSAGDGFGLLANGEQPGYIGATLEATTIAANAADATPTIAVHAKYVRTSAENMRGWATEARSLALELSAVADLKAVARPAARLLNLAKWLAVGDDVNADGEISPIVGEGGALVAYEHAQFMAGVMFFPTPTLR